MNNLSIHFFMAHGALSFSQGIPSSNFLNAPAYSFIQLRPLGAAVEAE
jgi:hypothetical protein